MPSMMMTTKPMILKMLLWNKNTKRIFMNSSRDKDSNST